MKLTRRKLASAMLAPAAAAAARQSAQGPAPDGLVEAARERYETNFAAVKKVKVPMATEPDFLFRA
jgi:hypothetical protein